MKKITYVALCAIALAVPASASAVCRVVLPAHESGEQPVTFDPTTMTLFVVAEDQLIDYRCPDPDHPGHDLSMREFLDIGPSITAARIAEAMEQRIEGLDREFEIPEPPPLPTADELDDDPTLCWDGSEAEPMYGPLVHVVVQPSIYADGGSAGLVMPVPRRADVHVAPSDIFARVSEQQEAVVEDEVLFQEDPSLGFQCSDPHYSALDPVIEGAAGAPMMLMGCGDAGDSSPYYRSGIDDVELEEETNEGGVVRYESIPTTEGYEVTMISASSLEALYAWMDDNGFAHTENDDYAFSSYIAEEAWFMAVRVAPPELGNGRVALPPLVVTWQGHEIPIMNRLQYQPGGGMLVTDAFVLAADRMGAADGDGTTLYAAPVDLTESPMLAGFGIEEGWLTHIELVRMSHTEKEDSSLVAQPGDEVRPVLLRRRAVRIAAPCCSGNAIPDQEGATRSFTERRVYLESEEPPDESLFFNSPEVDVDYCPGGALYDEPAYSDDYYYACSVDGQDHRLARRRFEVAGSWVPLLLAAGVIAVRRRRRR